MGLSGDAQGRHDDVVFAIRVRPRAADPAEQPGRRLVTACRASRATSWAMEASMSWPRRSMSPSVGDATTSSTSATPPARG
ncbi:hypothetical protein ACFH04_08395 [Streptomyces noboritoensis]|uniref:Uncharacterized protein n=1 Tax=Streptomyces noboritoensis TaxID=67337 RepID=A0ABV6TD54_9ACTN